MHSLFLDDSNIMLFYYYMKIISFFKTKKKNKKDATSSYKDIILKLENNDIESLNNLCRYYEDSPEEVIIRGLLLLQIVKNAEIDEQNFCIAEIDKQTNIVTSIKKILIY